MTEIKAIPIQELTSDEITYFYHEQYPINNGFFESEYEFIKYFKDNNKPIPEFVYGTITTDKESFGLDISGNPMIFKTSRVTVNYNLLVILDSNVLNDVEDVENWNDN